ncbi:MAG: NUDIX domain-containing protein [Clostridiales bacterium]|nr:NUDIX domain-containing protein [Clostridiales bacterium]
MYTIGSPIPGQAYYDREGAYLIAVKDGKFAAVREPKGYFLLGGGIEEGESHVECIMRECLEEGGIDVSVGELLDSGEMYTIHSKLGYFHPIQHYYRGEVIASVCEPTEPDYELVWLELSDYSLLYLPVQRAVIESLLKK